MFCSQGPLQEGGAHRITKTSGRVGNPTLLPGANSSPARVPKPHTHLAAIIISRSRGQGWGETKENRDPQENQDWGGRKWGIKVSGCRVTELPSPSLGWAC